MGRLRVEMPVRSFQSSIEVERRPGAMNAAAVLAGAVGHEAGRAAQAVPGAGGGGRGMDHGTARMAQPSNPAGEPVATRVAGIVFQENSCYTHPAMRRHASRFMPKINGKHFIFLLVALFSCSDSKFPQDIRIDSDGPPNDPGIPDYTVISGSYGTKHANQLFRLTVPKQFASKPFPVYVFMAGGGWSKPTFDNTAGDYTLEFVKAGLAFCETLYGYLDQPGGHGIFPGPEEDAQSIIAYLRENHELYNINPNAIVGGGRSAGAHNMLWAAYGETSSEAKSGRPNAVVIQQTAFAWLPAMQQDIEELSTKHFGSTNLKLNSVSQDQQILMSPIAWINAEYPGSDIPICVFAPDMELTKSTELPYPLDVVEWNHDVWCSFAIYEALSNSKNRQKHKEFSEFYWNGHPFDYDAAATGAVQAAFINKLFGK
jgi:hypothetical protein